MIESYSLGNMIIFAAEGDIVTGLSGLAAQGLTLWLIIFAVSFMVQSAKGGLGALTGKMRRSGEGVAGKARQWGDQEAKFIGAKQRGRQMASIGEKPIKRQKKNADGTLATNADGTPVMEEVKVPAYRRSGTLARYAARREQERKGVESEAEQIKTGMLAESLTNNEEYRRRVAGASMYGVESQREAAVGRARARGSGAYSKFLGESKEAFKSEITDDNLNLDQIETLAGGDDVEHNGKTFDAQYRAAAIDILADQGQTDRLIKVLQKGVPESIRGSVEYSLRTHYPKFKEKGHILNDKNLLSHFSETGELDPTLLQKAVKGMAGISVLEMATQKPGVLQTTLKVVNMDSAQRQALGIDDTTAEMIRAQARQVFQSQAAQAQLSGDTRALLHDIAQLPTNIGGPPPTITQPPGQAAA